MTSIIVLFLAVLFSPHLMTFAGQESAIEANAISEQDGHVEFFITNRSSINVDAYVILIETIPLMKGPSRLQTVRYVDVATNPREQTLLPGAMRRFRFAGPEPGPKVVRTEVSLKAAIFADGTSFGESAWVDKLLEMRKRMCLRANWALSLLESEKYRGRVTRDEIIDRIKQAASEAMPTAESVEDRMAIDAFEKEITANLALVQRSDGQSVSVQESLQMVVNHITNRRQRIMAAKPSIPGI